MFNGELFPSFRSNTKWGYKRADTNIFASLSVLFVLETNKNNFPRGYYENLRQKVLMALPKYENMHGVSTYNFWETRPTKHFPNGYILGKLKHFKLPDDIDDTALAFLLKGESEEQVKTLRKQVIHHSKPFEPSQSFAYNTWFGENMPYETDVCAVTNLMFLFQKVDLEPDQRDVATLTFLAQVIADGEYLEKPFQYARHYGSAPLIIYHLARLIGSFHIPVLESQRELLIEQANTCFENATKEIDRVLLQSSLLKLGFQFDFELDLKKIDRESFYPFIGAPFAPFKNALSRKLASKKWVIINWECEALAWAYCLENLYLRKFEI